MMTLIGIVGFRVHAAAQFIGSNPLENSIRNTSKSATAAGHFLKAILSILMIADSLVELEKWLGHNRQTKIEV
jgi:hypothetical protein